MFILKISRRDPLKLETPITLNGTLDIVNKRRIRGCHFLGYLKGSSGVLEVRYCRLLIAQLLMKNQSFAAICSMYMIHDPH